MSTTNERPLIALPAMRSARVQGLRYSGDVVASAVVEAVVRAGGDPVIVSPKVSGAIWDYVDGLVLPGGSDIDPRRYGQTPHDNHAGTDFVQQDDADALAISIAEQRGIPALLICRGMQLWNVERGGDMVQHWESATLQHVNTEHEVLLSDGSLVSEVLASEGEPLRTHEGVPGTTISVSSYHHQAVGRVGSGLRVTATAADGAIEALEDPEQQILAVQWHPEDRAERKLVDQRCFDWVVDQARRRMRRRANGGNATSEKPPLITKDELFPDHPNDGEVLIALVAQLNLPDQNWETYSLIKRFTTVAVETLQRCGARVALIDVTDDEEPDYDGIRQADGICVLGGGDLDPSFYGYEGLVKNEYGRDRRSDERQIQILRHAIDDDAITLAICRGSQVLNVACGGTIIPDLDPAELHRVTNGTGMFHDEEIELVTGTRVHNVFNRPRLTVRSGHHQAVANPGEGLDIAAKAHDGVIEAIERRENTWIVGVQWHPEDDDGPTEDRMAIFKQLVEQARWRMTASAS